MRRLCWRHHWVRSLLHRSLRHCRMRRLRRVCSLLCHRMRLGLLEFCLSLLLLRELRLLRLLCLLLSQLRLLRGDLGPLLPDFVHAGCGLGIAESEHVGTANGEGDGEVHVEALADEVAVAHEVHLGGGEAVVGDDRGRQGGVASIQAELAVA